MRPPVDTIPAPHFPRSLIWLGGEARRLEDLRGRPFLVEFWDLCRPSSLRTLQYVRAWHERYAGAGLVVLSVHAAGSTPGREEAAVRAAVTRLGIRHDACSDPELALWRAYGNEGWPARYLWDAAGHLREYHYGEGAYAETELAIQELVGVVREPLVPLHAEDEPSARIVVPTPDQAGAYSGPYAAGGVWGVFEGRGTIEVNGEEVVIEHSGAIALIEHPVHTEAVLSLRPGRGVTCHTVCFTPGLAPPGRQDDA